MAGDLNLTGNKISFTYLRLLQTNGSGEFFDGEGNPVNLKEGYSQETLPEGSGTNSISDGTFWFKTDTGILYSYINNGSTGQWIQT